MRIDHNGWPYDGRVGICRAGQCVGQHFLLRAESAIPGHWTLYLEPPFENFRLGDTVFRSFDEYLNSDSSAQALADEWQVEWLSEGPAEQELGRILFNMRRELVQNKRRRRIERRSARWRWLWSLGRRPPAP